MLAQNCQQNRYHDNDTFTSSEPSFCVWKWIKSLTMQYPTYSVQREFRGKSLILAPKRISKLNFLIKLEFPHADTFIIHANKTFNQ